MKIDERKLVDLDHAHLQGADFSGQKLLKFSAVGCRLQACRFDKSTIEDASFGAGHETSEYVECSFEGARIRHIGSKRARFVRCSFRDVEIHEWFCLTGELVDCVFSGRLHKAVFHGKVPDHERAQIGRETNEFHGNNFSAMKLIDVDFRGGIDLTQQRLPSGPEYLYVADAAQAVERARAQVIVWADLELRRSALVLIGILEKDVAGGQRQLFLRPAGLHSALGRDAVDAVAALLQAS
ncbi:MAG: hypothetical protein ABIJ48_04105 [Actinomycetota bacterium]